MRVGLIRVGRLRGIRGGKGNGPEMSEYKMMNIRCYENRMMFPLFAGRSKPVKE